VPGKHKEILIMTFEEAIKERIRKYYDPDHDEDGLESNSVSPNKYDRKYFDDFEQERLSIKKKSK